MAKVARGLPSDFSLNLPDEPPVVIGDFLDEPPPAPVARPRAKALPEERSARAAPQQAFRPEIVPDREEKVGERAQPRPVPRSSQPSIIRYQLNLTPKSKATLDELVKHVRTYSPQTDARTSEVFQGIMTLLHNSMDELDLAELPRRGAWGSVTAKNFPVALSEAFEEAILRAAKKRQV